MIIVYHNIYYLSIDFLYKIYTTHLCKMSRGGRKKKYICADLCNMHKKVANICAICITNKCSDFVRGIIWMEGCAVMLPHFASLFATFFILNVMFSLQMGKIYA